MAIEFDAETTKVIAAGRAAWAKLKHDETWTDWVAVGRALSAGKAAVMGFLRTNSPAGRQWSKHFGGWLRESGFDEIDKGVRSRLEKCMDHLPEIEAWRETIGVDRRQQWNHPNTVWRRFSTKHGVAPRERKAQAEALDVAVGRLEEVSDRIERANDGIGGSYDLSTPELVEESARNFVEMHGRDPSRAFAEALGRVLDPPPVKALSTKRSAVSMRKLRAREKSETETGAGGTVTAAQAENAQRRLVQLSAKPKPAGTRQPQPIAPPGR
jgi:hypothetical protein